jgi:hypothetical protein
MSNFQPSSITKYVLRNDNYNIIPVKIRLEQTTDPDTIQFGPGQELVFDIKYSGTSAKFYFQNAEVQRIDLNDGGTSDDLDTPNADHNKYNTLRYVGGKGRGYEEDVVNFDAGSYSPSFGDSDGIAGGPRATFRQTIEGSAITAAIRK